MWGQEWQNIYKLVQPYPDVHETDVTEEMKKQNWDVKKLFTMAEEFYTSLGLDRMTDTFWEKSMLIRPEDRDVQCHASSSDFYTAEDDKTKDDFR
jgi:peptidyl-dipeptidase A